MKKINYLGLIGIGFGALVLTGCGGKAHTLVCDLKSGDQSNHIEIEFNDDETKAEKISLELSMNVGDEATEEQIDQTKQYLEEGCKSSGYSDCKVSVDGKKIVYSYSTTPEESGMETTGKIEDVKKAAEEDGYTCK